MTPADLFLPGVPVDHVLHRLKLAGGNEVGSGKLASPESSAALAVNCFGWFIERPHLLPPMPNTPWIDWPARTVEVEYCARFPWTGGRHPWLDAVVATDKFIVGIESKRFEPFRDKKRVSLSSAYDRPDWGDQMKPFEKLRDDLRSGAAAFQYLDAAQLLKHAFGLITQARLQEKQAALVYVFAEPDRRGNHPISPEAILAHRSEVLQFGERVQSAATKFAAFSYVEWFDTWTGTDETEHALNLRRRFTLSPRPIAHRRPTA